VPAANLGDDGVGVFEAVHGTAPDIAGQDKANPTALLLSAILMLYHLNEDDKAHRIKQALWTALGDGSARTADLGGRATTTQFTDAIVKALG
jgi:isocitrate dehydrogenase (NAD+)